MNEEVGKSLPEIYLTDSLHNRNLYVLVVHEGRKMPRMCSTTLGSALNSLPLGETLAEELYRYFTTWLTLSSSRVMVTAVFTGNLVDESRYVAALR